MMLDFLNEPNPFSVYNNVESPEIKKLSLPLGDIDLEGTGLYVGSNGTVQAENNLPSQQQETSKFIVNNTEEHRPQQEEITYEESTSSTKKNSTFSKNKAYQFFLNKGLSPHHAAGIVGNLYAESGLNHKAVNPSSGAYGYAQWLGPRKKALFAKYGKNPTEEQQLEFLWEELNTTEKSAFNRLLQTQSVEEATNSFMKHFERPSQREMASSINKRIKFAKSLS